MIKILELNKETEIKFKVDESILSKLKDLKFESYDESDEYFFTQDTLDKDVYLRFRQKKGKIILTLKNITLGGERAEDCYEADEIDIELSEEQYEKLKAIFKVVFPIKWVVRKTRKKGLFNGCEICLDDVDGLGHFIEIEGPKEKILEICARLDLDLTKRDKERGYVKIGMKKAGMM